MKCVLLTMPKYADGVSFLAYSYIPLKYEPRNESRLSDPSSKLPRIPVYSLAKEKIDSDTFNLSRCNPSSIILKGSSFKYLVASFPIILVL